MCQRVANMFVCLEAYESGRNESCHVARGRPSILGHTEALDSILALREAIGEYTEEESGISAQIPFSSFIDLLLFS